MIKINLLPTEKRKAERTPLPRFLLIAATAATFFILLFYNLWILKKISDVKDEIASQSRVLNDLGPFVKQYDELSAEEARLKAKVNEIKELIGRDVEYWRTVNALWDVVHSNPRVWLDDLKILDAKSAPGELKRIDPDSKDTPPYGVSFRCHVAGEDVSEMTKFRTALKDNPTLQETLTLINFNVDWRVNEEKQFEETHSIDFSVSMFGLATPPKRQAPEPPGPKTATPVRAVQGGAK